MDGATRFTFAKRAKPFLNYVGGKEREMHLFIHHDIDTSMGSFSCFSHGRVVDPSSRIYRCIIGVFVSVCVCPCWP